jgi:hypothetical protein
MNSFDLKTMGVTGECAETDSYHFQETLNRVTIEGNEDYRLVLFFIRKGTVMPLHDHPNMSVYFKLMFGKLNYHVFDKVDEKFRYNQLSDMEYQELMETKAKISAKKSAPKLLEKNNLLLVRPSCGNMHKFVRKRTVASSTFACLTTRRTQNAASRTSTRYRPSSIATGFHARKSPMKMKKRLTSH